MTDIITIPAFRAKQLVALAESWQQTPSNKKAADMATQIKELLKQQEVKQDVTQTNFFDATEV